MNWFPEWSSIIGFAIIFGTFETVWRIRRIRRRHHEHRVAHFFGWPIDTTGKPTRLYWIEGVTRADVENALYGYTDQRWGWLCRPAMRRALVVANPISWALTIYGATDLPLSLGHEDKAFSWWVPLPIVMWFAVQRSVRLIADAPAELLDERLVALRDRNYVGSYRLLANGVGLIAVFLIIAKEFDSGDGLLGAQTDVLIGAAYAALWAVPALPSVLLAWTLRNESFSPDDSNTIQEFPERIIVNDSQATDNDSSAPDDKSSIEKPIRKRGGLTFVAVLLGIAFIAGLILGVVNSDPEKTTTELEWTPTKNGLEQARLSVPVDHENADGESLSLRILRRPADDAGTRIGSLIVNPGGPGFGAEQMVTLAKEFFGKELLQRFDIVGFDPRGTGQSTPAIDCIDDFDALTRELDITPADETAREGQIAAYAKFAKACIERTGDAIAHMSTHAVARDIDLLRRALGEEKISYFGTSYGCELGATWATLFPDTVRAAVLDGCSDPERDPIESVRQQAIGFQSSVEAFIAKCLEVGDECPIPHTGDPADALRELWSRAAEEGIPSMPGRPAVNESVLQTALIAAMYSEDTWPALASGIALALDGDGNVLMQLNDAYNQRREDGTWGNEMEAFVVISCLDSSRTPSKAEREALDTELSMIAPLLYPKGIFSGSFCDALPAAAEKPVTITGVGTPTLVVIGNTGDPATPFASTQRMAESLASSVLIAVESFDHGGYGTNECVNGAVHRYLIDNEIPEDNKRC